MVQYYDPPPKSKLIMFVSNWKRSFRRLLPKVRISLPIVIQVRSRVCASSSFTSHQHNFTLSYPVKIKFYFHQITDKYFQAIKKESKQNSKAKKEL